MTSPCPTCGGPATPVLPPEHVVGSLEWAHIPLSERIAALPETALVDFISEIGDEVLFFSRDKKLERAREALAHLLGATEKPQDL